MLVSVDVETPVWQGSGSDGMLGCSAGDSGRWRGIGLTGGNPGVVGFSSCCGSPGTESLTFGLFPSAWPSSETGASMLGVGASGSVSSGSVSFWSVPGGSAVTAGGSIEAGRSIAVERFVAARRSLGDDEAGGARVLRCALQVQKASEVRPTMAGTRRAHPRSGLRCIPGMLILLDIRTMMPDDRPRNYQGLRRSARRSTSGPNSISNLLPISPAIAVPKPRAAIAAVALCCG